MVFTFLSDLFFCFLDIFASQSMKTVGIIIIALFMMSTTSVVVRCSPFKVCRFAKSCSEIKSLSPQATDGTYVIDPDGERGLAPFNVSCDMTDKNGVGVTVIGHDSEDRTVVNGYEEKGSYARDVHYSGGSVAQLASLTVVSAYCEQFIKYECRSALLLYPVGNPHSWWVSRNSSKMTYWGGATPADSHKCACGVTSPNSCANPDRGCNCDKNDGVWREDSGLLTEKSDLPVLQLRIGDTGLPEETGYHTLGKLKCYGIA